MAWIVLLTAQTGCDLPKSDSKNETPPATTVEHPIADQVIWYSVRMGNARIGHERFTIRRMADAATNEPRIEVSGESRVVIRRERQATEQTTRFRSVETLEGRMMEYESESQQGQTPMKASGKAVGADFQLKIRSMQKEVEQTIPWPYDCGGPGAMTLSLLRRPMQPGEKRSLRCFMPGLEQLADVDMTAKGYEPIQSPTADASALRIHAVTHFPNGPAFQESIWCDASGNVLRHSFDAMGIESVRTTAQEATQQEGLGELDLIAQLSVPVQPPLAKGHKSRKVVYRVTSSGEDPAKLFPSGPTQKVESIDPETAKITVTAVQPSLEGERSPVPPADTRESSVVIQSDYPKITAMARKATQNAKNDWQAAKALESFAKQYITKKDYASAFSTAAEVADHRTGDCTEHAVFLAALARAHRVPARVAVGLVYMPANHSFYFHMWDEFYIHGQWIPMDSTLGLGGIGAGHLKLADTALKTPSEFLKFLPVLLVAGKLKIAIESEQ